LVIIKWVLFVVCIVGSALASSHTKLKSSVPEDQSVLTIDPTSISLMFNKAVNLITLSIKDNNNNKVKTAFTANAHKATSFTIPFSKKLHDSNYSVRWVVIGADGHKARGDFSFTLKYAK